MNARILLAASLVLSGFVLMPSASACESSIDLVQYYVCEGNTPPVPCLSVRCVEEDALGVVAIVVGCVEPIIQYDWIDYDPAHDPVPSFVCINLTN